MPDVTLAFKDYICGLPGVTLEFRDNKCGLPDVTLSFRDDKCGLPDVTLAFIHDKCGLPPLCKNICEGRFELVANGRETNLMSFLSYTLISWLH